MRDQEVRPPEQLPAAQPPQEGPPEPGVRRRRRAVAGELTVLAAYLAAGIAVTWPRVATGPGRVPAVRDISSYVWALWWVAHQAVHLANPWFTGSMAAPVGIQLGYDTTMPLLGVLLAPVTLTAGPAAAFWLITILLPGLACYVMYRVALLWLGRAGALAAGALYGLAPMLDWQVWFHLNIAAGMVLLPAALGAAVRLRRSGRRRDAVLLGVVLGVSVLINQETALLAGAIAGAVLIAAVATGWLTSSPIRTESSVPIGEEDRGGATVKRAGAGRAGAGRAGAGKAGAGKAGAGKVAAAGLAVAVALAVASPQLIAMAQQARSGGAFARPAELAGTYLLYGAQLPGLFGPSPRLGSAGLSWLASGYHYPQAAEGVPAFGLALTLAALAGLILSVRPGGRAPWRRSTAWLLAAGWLGSAVLALGPTLRLGTRTYVPLAQAWHGVHVSLAMPYTWLVRVPGLSAFREADRLALAGLAAAALLAGFTADRLATAIRERWTAPRPGTPSGPARAPLSDRNRVFRSDRREGQPSSDDRPGGHEQRDGSAPSRLRTCAPLAVAAVVTAFALLEMGWSGFPHRTTVPTAYPELDRPIADDFSSSVVVDIPFGLRGGIPLYGSGVNARSLLMATADGHPRAISYTSWVPRHTTAGIQAHPFYARLNAAQHGRDSTPRQLAAARRDARRMHVGWVVDWKPRTPEISRFLAGAGFRLDYTVSGVAVYRPAGVGPVTP